VGTAVSGLLVLLASGRVWSSATARLPGAAVSKVSVTGHAVEPSLPALGIALLALAAGLIAAKGALRRLVGALVVVVGGTALGVAVAGLGSVSSALTAHEPGGLSLPIHGTANGWWVMAAIGGLLAVIVGGLAVGRSGNWAALGRKYEAPGTPQRVAAGESAVSTWDALDRGEDPTE
jgi:hypothetical protein